MERVIAAFQQMGPRVRLKHVSEPFAAAERSQPSAEWRPALRINKYCGQGREALDGRNLVVEHARRIRMTRSLRR